MIPLEKFLSKYDILKAKELEHQDPQFLALEKCWWNTQNKDTNLFLFLVIQCSLVSYQIAWSGELRRTEFGKKIQKDWNILLDIRNKDQSNTERRFNFLKTSKNNKRIYNIKKSRIEKLNKLLNTEKDFFQYHNNLEELNNILAKTMNTQVHSKTIVFAIKMFGYAYTIISWKDIDYPISINIPVDSRLKKIYRINENKDPINELEIYNYFWKLSKKFQIPPLDLDAILWLDYRRTIK